MSPVASDSPSDRALAVCLRASVRQIGMTALMVAGMRNNTEAIKNLLACGADLDAKEWVVSGRTHAPPV